MRARCSPPLAAHPPPASPLPLLQIAGVATRPLIGMEEEPSELERVCLAARAAAPLAAAVRAAFWEPMVMSVVVLRDKVRRRVGVDVSVCAAC